MKHITSLELVLTVTLFKRRRNRSKRNNKTKLGFMLLLMVYWVRFFCFFAFGFVLFFPLEKRHYLEEKALRAEVSPSMCLGALLHKQPATEGSQAHLQSERKIQ